MGVPSFYRWLIEKYPKITHKYFYNPSPSEASSATNNNDNSLYADVGVISSFNNQPTTQVFKCDNLYIDMNGIVHNATHGKVSTKEEFDAQVKHNLFYSLDRILFAAQPQKLLYLALDGVPPRAKAAEQRQRRYKTALALRRSKAHASADPSKAGTEFMVQVHGWLNEFLSSRAASRVGLEIVLSDTSVPGEGEHKIMDVIRGLIAQKVYDENTHHMFYGLDADLVFLGLATTAKYFTVLRDSHVYTYCRRCGLPEHPTYECVKKLARSGHTICVGRIPSQTEHNVVVNLFSTCGEINRYLADYSPNRPWFMFIDFKDASAAASALQGGWMLSGKSLSVVYAEFDIFAINNIIAVTRIPAEATNEELVQWFSVFGEIKHVWSPPQRAVYIEYKDAESANKARLFRWETEKNMIVRSATPRQARPSGGKRDRRRKVSKPGETASTEEAKGQPEVAATLHKLEDQKDSEDDQSISAGKENESDKTPVAEKDDEGEEDGEEHGEEDGEEDAEESTEEELEEPTKRTNADVDDEKKVWRFELTQLHTLCEYFEHEFAAKQAIQFVPDFVLFSAFVGNDFVRPLPNLTIAGGSLDLLFEIYKRMGPSFSLVKSGHVQLKNLALFMEEMVTYEKTTFTRPRFSAPRREGPPRSDAENNNNNNNNTNHNNSNPHRRYGSRGRNRSYKPRPQATTTDKDNTPTIPQDATATHPPPTESSVQTSNVEQQSEPNLPPQPQLLEANAKPPKPTTPPRIKPTPRVRDPVQIYHDWRVRFYQYKLGIDTSKTDDIEKVCRSYLDSLVWVLRYYLSGVPSWSWFYPFHYAPIACDFLAYLQQLIQNGHESTESIQFPTAAPIKPLYHLMSILPVESVQCVPASYQPLMTSPTSPVADLYPTNFQIDSNGNRFGSQSVVLVDFVDANRLVQHLTPLDSTLSDQETKRNTFGADNTITSASPTTSPPSSSSSSSTPYRIQQSPLSSQDFQWVRRRSGFALPPPSSLPIPCHW